MKCNHVSNLTLSANEDESDMKTLKVYNRASKSRKRWLQSANGQGRAYKLSENEVRMQLF